MKKETQLTIKNKISSSLDLLDKLKNIFKNRQQEKNPKLKEYLLYAAEKKAEELVELAVSINQELLKEKGKVSSSYYNSFADLKLFPFFSREELAKLAATAGFRNRLAHEYLDLDEKITLNSMKKILILYPLYLKKIKQFVLDSKNDN